MNKKSYIDAFKIIECLLEQQKEFTISDLAVQFGCMEASNLAQRIYERWKAFCLPFHQSVFLEFYECAGRKLNSTYNIYSKNDNCFSQPVTRKMLFKIWRKWASQSLWELPCTLLVGMLKRAMWAWKKLLCYVKSPLLSSSSSSSSSALFYYWFSFEAVIKG